MAITDLERDQQSKTVSNCSKERKKERKGGYVLISKHFSNHQRLSAGVNQYPSHPRVAGDKVAPTLQRGSTNTRPTSQRLSRLRGRSSTAEAGAATSARAGGVRDADPSHLSPESAWRHVCSAASAVQSPNTGIASRSQVRIRHAFRVIRPSVAIANAASAPNRSRRLGTFPTRHHADSQEPVGVMSPHGNKGWDGLRCTHNNG